MASPYKRKIKVYKLGIIPLFKAWVRIRTVQSVTGQNLETIKINWCQVSSFQMLFQAFTAAAFICCFFVGCSTFSFVYSKRAARSAELSSGN